MGKSLYRRAADIPFGTVISSRWNNLTNTQHVDGRSLQDVNPAYISITGTCNMCDGGIASMTVPTEKDTWDALYRYSMKPRPTLQSVDITYGGDWGLARKITANIKCYDQQSFKEVTKAFLMPGNFISATFGYSTSQQWNSHHYSPITISNFRVATFSFSAGDDGTWIGTFTAVSAAEAMKTIDMTGVLSGGLTYSYSGVFNATKTSDVTGIAQLIASDAQRNGSQALDRVNAGNTGYVISGGQGFQNYTQTDSHVKAGMVIYTSDHLHTMVGNIMEDAATWFSKMGGVYNDAENPEHQIYVSLAYVTDRLVNGVLKKTIDDNISTTGVDAPYTNLKIRYHAEYSKSTIPNHLASGDPKSVLLLGAAHGCKFTSDEGKVMDFNELKGNSEGSSADVIAVNGNIVDLDKILVHRNAVLSAIASATEVTPNESETVDPKNSKDVVVDFNDFFTELFSIIKSCTGGALALRLVIDPTDETGNTLLVVDQNYGGDQEIPCYIFNPVDGDGNTIQCNISSAGGSDEYRSSMFIGTSKKGDAATKLRGCKPQLDTMRRNRFIDAQIKYLKLTNYPGTMMSSQFNGKDIDAFKSVMVDIYQCADNSHTDRELINWPGMSIDITIHGAWGILPGCAIMTTQMPSDWYYNYGIYFMVREVTHNFSNSVWTTNMRGIMSYYNHLTDVGGWGTGGGPRS